MTQKNEDKPIYNIRFFSDVKEPNGKNDSILSWKETKLKAYLKGVFDSSGSIYFNDSKEIILTLKNNHFSKLELYQKVLQVLGIFSFMHYPQAEDEIAELYIVGKSNIERFEKQIGFECPMESEILYNFNKIFDWED